MLQPCNKSLYGCVGVLPITSQTYLKNYSSSRRTCQHIVALRVKSKKPSSWKLDLLVATVPRQNKRTCSFTGKIVFRHLQATFVNIPLNKLEEERDDKSE